VSKPLSPSEAFDLKQKVIPDKVIDIINEMILENFNGGIATLQQAELVRRMKARLEDFQERWLDFEDVYRKQGWKVTYDKPGYNETYPAIFVFESGKRKGQPK